MLNLIKNILKVKKEAKSMKKVLYITANPKKVENSFSLWAGEEFLKGYKQNNPNDEIKKIDVYAENIPLIDSDVLNAWGKFQGGASFDALTEAEKQKVARMNEIVDEFISADKYIFVSPLWNFTIPPMLKAYIDNICIAGKTFKYTENGPVGLLSGKKALHIQASGSIYTDAPIMEMELGDRYLKTVLSFIGVNDFESILLEGTALLPRDEVKNKALGKINDISKRF
jgi:FMN-dependent NADH-azoreductase